MTIQSIFRFSADLFWVDGTDPKIYPPEKPSLTTAKSWLDRELGVVAAKLTEARRQGIPPEQIEKGMQIQSLLQTTSAEQILLELSAEYERHLAEWEFGHRRRIWTQLRSKVGQLYEGCSFETFQVTCPAQRKVVTSLRHYVEDLPRNIRDGVSVVLHGPVGTGKDHLLTALSRCAILDHGISIRFRRGVVLAEEAPLKLRSGWGQKWEDVLALSDPCPPGGLDQAGGYKTRETANWLYKLVDDYYRERKPIWIAFNVADRAHAVEQLGAQLVDRILDRAIVLNCNWPTARKPKEGNL